MGEGIVEDAGVEKGGEVTDAVEEAPFTSLTWASEFVESIKVRDTPLPADVEPTVCPVEGSCRLCDVVLVSCFPFTGALIFRDAYARTPSRTVTQ